MKLEEAEDEYKEKYENGDSCCNLVFHMTDIILSNLKSGLDLRGHANITDARDRYQKRRDIVYGLLHQISGVICEKPEGAFYLIAKLPVDNVEKFLTWLLTDFEIEGETVMAAPAEGFYQTEGLGKNEIRIAYVLDEPELSKAIIILVKGLERYLANPHPLSGPRSFSALLEGNIHDK